MPQIIISVPHSGSRSLTWHLEYFADEQGLSGNGRWWHFGKHNFSRAYRRKWTDEHYAHIPIRHPLMVAQSWASRDKTGDVLENMLGCYEEMFEYLEKFPASFYRMEDFPKTRGMNDRKVFNAQRIALFQSAVREHVIEPHREFFEQFYDDL